MLSCVIIFDKKGSIVVIGQKEYEQIFFKVGWVEYDVVEIWCNVQEVIGFVFGCVDFIWYDIVVVGIMNQCEIVVVWDRKIGKLVYNVIVWQDMCMQVIVDCLVVDGGVEWFKCIVGFFLVIYFFGIKIVWILENVDGVCEKVEVGDFIFGMIDSWVLWNFIGGVDGGVYVIDVINVLCMMFMDFEMFEWCDDIFEVFGVLCLMMLEICFFFEVYGMVESFLLLCEILIVGIFGDQQVVMFGQVVFQKGESKNIYGIGCFFIFNMGEEVVYLKNGLLMIVGYKLGDQLIYYVLEGLIVVIGLLIQWFCDQFGIIFLVFEVEKLVEQVEDNGGVYIVLVFFGFFVLYWCLDVCGVIVGFICYVNKNYIVCVVLEVVVFQICDVLDVVNVDVGVDFMEFKVDGGMVVNDVLMQFQVDVFGVLVVWLVVVEIIVFGVVYVVGFVVGFWNGFDDLFVNWQEDKCWELFMDDVECDCQLWLWCKVVMKLMDWVDDDVK